MTSISSRTHPDLTPAERRAERARTERALYTLTETEFRLTRKSDGARGRIRFVIVEPVAGGETYTVRLRNNGDPCRCSCLDWTRRQERDGAAVEPCKHQLMLLQDRAPEWPAVQPEELEAATELQRWSAKVLAERALLWD